MGIRLAPVRQSGALALRALWSRLETHRKNTRFGKELEARYGNLHAAVERLYAGLADRPNPLSTHERSSTLQKAILPELPPIEAAWPKLQVADAAVERWVQLRVRMLMRLAALAEPAEKAAIALEALTEAAGVAATAKSPAV
ncbi:MAG: hypothetical protein ABIV06_09940 [Thermoanaerobaculia bacterium]